MNPNQTPGESRNSNNCEIILLRQFDADCRTGAPLPANVATHLASCDNCRQQWAELRAFDHGLKLAMTVEPPVELYRAAYRAAVELDEAPVKANKRWLQAGYALLAGVAVGQGLLMLPWTADWPWLAPIGFLAVSAALFVRDLYQETTALPPV
ncbi:MAG: hypothetical protein ACOY3E_03185 [Pseudomonadota bacterium]